MPLRYFCCFLGPRIQSEKKTHVQLEQDYRANPVTLPTPFTKGKQCRRLLDVKEPYMGQRLIAIDISLAAQSYLNETLLLFKNFSPMDDSVITTEDAKRCNR